MSSHVLDLAGGRGLNLTLNDPARTSASASSKPGEDVSATLSGAREIRLELPVNARVQIRSYEQKQIKKDANGKPMDDPDKPHHYLYEPADPIERMILVLPGSTVAFMRVSNELFEDDDPAKPTYEGHPHTNIVARRQKEPHFTESGTLVRELEVSDLVGTTPTGE